LTILREEQEVVHKMSVKTQKGNFYIPCTNGISNTAEVPTSDSEIADQAINALVYVQRAADGLELDADVVVPTLTMRYPSLSLESKVRYNLYYSAENIESVCSVYESDGVTYCTGVVA
jgi:hypothetical protein